MKTIPTLLGAAACAALLSTGCGAAAEKVNEKATEKMIEEQTGGNVDIDTDGNGSVEIATDEGTASFGTGEVPKEWPDTLVLPDDLEIQSGSTMDSADGQLVSIIGTTAETPEALLARYKEALADWEISGESTSTGNGATLTSAQWDDGEVRVTFAASAGVSDDRTFLTLGHTTLE